MPQTVLAFLAILLLTSLSLSQRDSKIRAYKARIGAQTELLAHGVGIGVIEMIAAEPFDEAATGGKTVDDPDELTAPSFSNDDPSGARDDVDDYHGARLVRTFGAGDDTTKFQVDVVIHYVDDRGARVNHRTYNKEIEVTLRPDSSGAAAASDMASTVTLKRPISYAPH